MIHNFITAHRFLTYAAGGTFFALVGYLEARTLPRDPLMAIGTWTLALLWFSFDLATTRSLLPVGPVLGLAVLIGGAIWMARYYRRHRTGREGRGQ